MIAIEALTVLLDGFALKHIDLKIAKNEFFMLMGSTGAGKTVLLEAIAGLTPVAEGKIVIGGRDVTRLPPEKRDVGIVYQDQALFPHLSVRQNITYGLRFHGVADQEGKKRLDRLCQWLDIDRLLHRLPVHLSGGEKQRVALARALIVQPRVLLLDEPLSALDPMFREEIRCALKRLHQNTGTTFVMVTHDFAEALALADRGAVIDHGAIEQVGAIHDIFQRPSSCAVADFVGMKNLFAAKFQDGQAEVNGMTLRLNAPCPKHRGHVAIRPEDIELATKPFGTVRGNTFAGRVTAVTSHGFTYEVHVKAGNLTFKVLVTKKVLVNQDLNEGREVFVHFDARAVHCL